MIIHKASASLMLLEVQRIYFGHLRHKVSIEVDSVVEGMGRGELLHVLLLKDPLDLFEGDW
jgi:hypothetical protein